MICNKCGATICPPKITCQECTGLNLEIIELSGCGKIATFTTVYVAPRGREAETPYTIVLVKLEEGPWIMGNLIEIGPTMAGTELMGKK